MHTGQPPLLVFDLDGTLVDTAADLMATLNALLVREGHRPLPFSAVGSLVGQGARVMLERGLRANGVEVEEAFLHCAKAFIRSGLWEPERWADDAVVPSSAAMFAAHLAIDRAAIEADLEEAYTREISWGDPAAPLPGEG